MNTYPFILYKKLFSKNEIYESIEESDTDFPHLNILIELRLFDQNGHSEIRLSAFLFRDRDHPVTVSSLGVLNRPTSLSVLDRSKASLTVLSLIFSKDS